MPRKKKNAEPESTPEVEIQAEQPAAAEPEDKPVKKKRASKKAKAAEELAIDPIAAVPEVPGPEHDEAEAVAQAADTFDEAFEADGPAEVSPVESEDEADEEAEDEPTYERPPAKLERLQKILAQAGVASRRHAEELITGGHVQVNGKVVTELGSKADPNRDHIRVDGKLLQGAERHRYFVLNKPKGYVTTVSDPEGRPTVMEFFAKSSERLYPVGRLDYLSEGLLLFTNDGDLANKLTRAASGVEKVYLVKVSGQPDEDAIDQLREGVSIDRGAPGEGRVRTSPARIRQVRQGDNPWYEVTLIEGRNRELRKMFEEIGHHVEKIRRVGYGPLVLDQEPGKMRELEPEEVEALQLAAEGKLKRSRFKTTKMLPKEAGRPVEYDADQRKGRKPFRKPEGERGGRDQERPRGGGQSRSGGQTRGGGAGRGFDRRGSQEFRPAAPRGEGKGPQTGRTFGSGGDRERRPAAGFGDRGATGAGRSQQRPAFGERPRSGGDREQRGAGFGDRARTGTSGRTGGGFNRQGGRFERPAQGAAGGERRSFTRPPREEGGERRTFARPPREESGARPFRGRPAGGERQRPERGGFAQRPPQGPRQDRFSERPAARPRPEQPRPERPSRPRIEIEEVGETPRRTGENVRPGAGQRTGGFGQNRGQGFDRAGSRGGAGRRFERPAEGRERGSAPRPPRREGGFSGGAGAGRSFDRPRGGEREGGATRPPRREGGFAGSGGREQRGGAGGNRGFGGRGGARPSGGGRPSSGGRPAGGGRPSSGAGGQRGGKPGGRPGGRPSSGGNRRPGGGNSGRRRP